MAQVRNGHSALRGDHDPAADGEDGGDRIATCAERFAQGGESTRCGAINDAGSVAGGPGIDKSRKLIWRLTFAVDKS
jgi:hypothetical protein